MTEPAALQPSSRQKVQVSVPLIKITTCALHVKEFENGLRVFKRFELPSFCVGTLFFLNRRIEYEDSYSQFRYKFYLDPSIKFNVLFALNIHGQPNAHSKAKRCY